MIGGAATRPRQGHRDRGVGQFDVVPVSLRAPRQVEPRLRLRRPGPIPGGRSGRRRRPSTAISTQALPSARPRTLTSRRPPPRRGRAMSLTSAGTGTPTTRIPEARPTWRSRQPCLAYPRGIHRRAIFPDELRHRARRSRRWPWVHGEPHHRPASPSPLAHIVDRGRREELSADNGVQQGAERGDDAFSKMRRRLGRGEAAHQVELLLLRVAVRRDAAAARGDGALRYGPLRSTRWTGNPTIKVMNSSACSSRTSTTPASGTPVTSRSMSPPPWEYRRVESEPGAVHFIILADFCARQDAGEPL